MPAVRIRLSLLFEEVLGHLLIRVGVRMLQRTRLDVECGPIVPRLGVFFGELVPLALLRDDVDDNGLRHVLDRGECRDQCLAVVAVCDVTVVEAHRTEEVVALLAAALAQRFERAIHPAVVLSDGVAVVVEHDDEVRIHLADDIQPLERLAAREGAVADECDHVFPASREIARLCEP